MCSAHSSTLARSMRLMLTLPRFLKEAITATLRYVARATCAWPTRIRLAKVSYSEVDGDMRVRGIVLQPWRSILGEVALGGRGEVP